MKKIFQTFGLFSVVMMLCFAFTLPFAAAQENLFDTLEDIKEGVEKPQERIEEGGEAVTKTVKVIDFSEDRPWGNLPENVQEELEGTYDDLKHLRSAYNPFIDQHLEDSEVTPSDANYRDVLNEGIELFFDSFDLTPDEIALVISEMQFRGESQLQSVILAVAKVMRNLIGGLAILWIVVSGIQMVLAHGEESKITEQKRSITYAVIGLVVILLLERGVTLLYGVPGAERGFLERPEGISEEILGVVSFMKAIIGAAAILMIIISGFKTIAAEGEEEKLSHQKKAILWVIIGIVVIMVNEFVVENLYIEPATRQIIQSQELIGVEGEEFIPQEEQQGIAVSNVQNIINLIGTVVQFVLGFTGLIAFAALIYGAGSMVANYGNDEMVDRAKKIIKNALIGIIIILSAFALVATVIKFG